MMIPSKRKSDNILNYPYFKREDTFDTHFSTSSTYSYKYTLLGVAKINTAGLEIYDSYFYRRYTKKYD
jgi:hypothetical protein